MYIQQVKREILKNWNIYNFSPFLPYHLPLLHFLPIWIHPKVAEQSTKCQLTNL